jgi:hypothetical protein
MVIQSDPKSASALATSGSAAPVAGCVIAKVSPDTGARPVASSTSTVRSFPLAPAHLVSRSTSVVPSAAVIGMSSTALIAATNLSQSVATLSPFAVVIGALRTPAMRSRR